MPSQRMSDLVSLLRVRLTSQFGQVEESVQALEEKKLVRNTIVAFVTAVAAIVGVAFWSTIRSDEFFVLFTRIT